MSTQDEHVAKLQIEFEVLIGQANQVLAEITDNVSTQNKEWDKLSRTVDGATQIFNNLTGRGAAAAASVKEQTDAWSAYAQKLKDAAAAYQQFQKDQVTGSTTPGAKSLEDFTGAQKQQLLDIDAANKASVTAAINDEQRAAQQKQAIREGEDRIYNQLLGEQTTARQKAVDESIALAQRQTRAIVDEYTKQYQAAVKIDEQIAADQQSKRYATPTPASRNTAAPGAIAAAQDEYSAQQLAQMNQYYAALEKQGQATTNLADSALPRLRYAMYDVSFAAAAAGAGMLASGLLIAKTSVEYEKLYADVQRTYTGIQGLDKGVQLDNLRQQLLQLTADLPVTFQQVTQIATMGNQLNIPAAALQSFTKTVAEFSATTNVSVDAAATAFGRLGQLLKTTDYRALGDAIAYLGVNAVATESQIIGVSQQIAVSANAAGFTTSQTLALATALASLGVAPEAARGSLLRTFSDISAAVQSGGTKLNDIAAISGTTSEAFAKNWRDNAGGAFTQFVGGLSKNTAGIKDNLNALGITAARDVQAISLLAQNMNVLDQANTDVGKSAGYLDKAFGDINSTVSSKITKLGNDFQRLFDTIGSSANGPIGAVVDALGGIVNFLNDIEKNPFIAWSTSAGAAIVTLGGVLLIAFAALARMQGSMLAVATAGGQMNEQGGASSILFDILTFKALRLTATNDGLAASNRAVATSQGAANVEMEAGSVATNATAASGGKLASVLGKAGLIGAVLALVASAPAFVTALKDWADGMSGAAQNADDLAAKFDLISKSAKSAAAAQAEASAKNALGYLTNRPDVLYDDGHGARSYTGAQLAANKATTGSYTPGTDFNLLSGGAAINNLGDSATKQITAYDQAISSLVAAGKMDAANAALKTFHEQMAAGGVEAGKADILLTATNSALGVTAGASTTAALALKAQQAATDDAGNAFKDYMASAYDTINAQQKLSTDLGSLGSAFAKNGADVAGNGSEIQAVISDIYATASDPSQAAAQMQGFFNALQAGGYATASQLSGLQEVIWQLTGGKGTAATPFDLSSLTNGFNTAQASIDKTAQSAQQAAQQVHTLVDYANDLTGVFQRAFDIRYGGSEGLDTISKAWDTIRSNAASAATAMATANGKLQQLASDKSINEYWLSVANMYGDTLRASQIQATLTQNALDTTSAQKDLATAQDQSNTTLVGNSKAAQDNRASILGLVGNYESYIEKLAASGASQATLKATAAQLKQEFITQATQLGFNVNELGTYAASFDDVTTAISRVPRNITVSANADPAIQALNEFIAHAKSTIGNGLNVPITSSYDPSQIAKAARAQTILAQINSLEASMLPSATTDSQISRNQSLQAQIAALNAKLQSNNYWSGGYTGDGGMYDYAGAVHKGEFVFSAAATSNIGVGNLAFAHEMAKAGKSFSVGSGDTGMGGGIVQLSPADRQLLTTIANRVGLTVSGPALAGIVGAGNINTTNRGAG